MLNQIYGVCCAGIMLLEKQLLCNSGDDQCDGPSAKRARTSHRPLPETTGTWVELSKYVCVLLSNSFSECDFFLFVTTTSMYR